MSADEIATVTSLSHELHSSSASARSMYEAASRHTQQQMLYTRMDFYAQNPTNASVYAPVEASGAHDWSRLAPAWIAYTGSLVSVASTEALVPHSLVAPSLEPSSLLSLSQTMPAACVPVVVSTNKIECVPPVSSGKAKMTPAMIEAEARTASDKAMAGRLQSEADAAQAKLAAQIAQDAAYARKIEQAEAKKRAGVALERAGMACQRSVAVGSRVVSFKGEPTIVEYTYPRGSASRASRRTVARGLRRLRRLARVRADEASSPPSRSTRRRCRPSRARCRQGPERDAALLASLRGSIACQSAQRARSVSPSGAVSEGAARGMLLTRSSADPSVEVALADSRAVKTVVQQEEAFAVEGALAPDAFAQGTLTRVEVEGSCHLSLPLLAQTASSIVMATRTVRLSPPLLHLFVRGGNPATLGTVTIEVAAHGATADEANDAVAAKNGGVRPLSLRWGGHVLDGALPADLTSGAELTATFFLGGGIAIRARVSNRRWALKP